jgi:hypothetical protein
MPFQVSPGVNVSEIDLTTSTPSVATSIGALVGKFSWGPVGEIVNISTETELVKYFGKPTSENYQSWFTAANFLAYASSLRVNRVIGAGALNSVAGIAGSSTPVDATEDFVGVAEATDNLTGVGATTQNETGDGTTASITLNSAPAGTASVSVNGVTLTPDVQYTITGTTLDFAAGTAPYGAPANSHAIVITVTAKSVFTLSRDAFGETVAVTVGGASDTNISVDGTSLTFTNPPADGATIVATIPARTRFTISENVDATDTVGVTVAAVDQTVTTDYSVSGQVVTFVSAPADSAAVQIKVFGAPTVNYTYTPVLIKSVDDITFNSGQGGGAVFAARCAGTDGDKFKTYMVDAATFSELPANLKSLFNTTPSVGEVHVLVVQRNTNGSETVLERYEYLSKASNGKAEDGKNMYYKEVINLSSEYVWVINHPADGTDWGSEESISKALSSFASLTSAEVSTFSGGNNGTAPTAAEVISGYDLYADPELVDVSLVMSGQWADIDSGNTVLQHIVQNICEVRKDCVALLSPRYVDVKSGSAQNIVSYFNTTVGAFSNYAFVDSNFKYQYDKYNDVYRWVPFNGDIAGLMARTDAERDTWFSPAGFNRGVIKNVIKVAWNQNKADRDDLYKASINPVVTFPGQGTILYGDKTFTNKPSAFDRINVRRLFIILEKSIATASKFTLFEFNDEFTRSQFVSLVEPFLRDVKGRRGIYDFLVVCDETNNTSEVVDRNEFIGDIYIKPARSINYIQLNFVAVRTGVSFEEVVGQA